MVTCSICEHPDRYEIESALLNLSSSTVSSQTINYQTLAEEYNVSLNELKVHALMHMPVATTIESELPQPSATNAGSSGATSSAGADPVNSDSTSAASSNPASSNSSVDSSEFCDCSPAIVIKPDGTTSLTNQMKLREASMLLAVANEYLLTLKNVGRKINHLANSPDIDDELLFTRVITKPIVDLYIGTGSEIRATIKTIAEVNQIINGEGDDGASAGLKALAEALKTSATSSEPPMNVLNFTSVDQDSESTIIPVEHQDDD